jgi:hypothetical protein
MLRMRRHRYNVLCLIGLQLIVACGCCCQTARVDERNQLIGRLQHLQGLPDEIVLATLESADERVQKGDTLVLSALFDLVSETDGYVAEFLGTILGELILHKPEFFLNALLTRPKEQQSEIAAMAFYMDGGGMPSKDFDKIEQILTNIRVSKQQHLAELAKICLTALREVRKEVQN